MAYYTQNKELESAESKSEQGLDLHDLVLGALTIISVFIPIRSAAQNMAATTKDKQSASRIGIPKKAASLNRNSVQDEASIVFSVVTLVLSVLSIAILGVRVFFTFYLEGVAPAVTDVMAAPETIFAQIFVAISITILGVGFTVYALRRETKVLPHVLSIYTSIVLFIVMVGFAKLAYDVFIADIQLSDPNNMFLMTLRVFVAGIAFLPALGLSHFGIHKLNDGLLPYTTRVFGWFCMALTGFLHLKIVYNITISLVPATRSIVYVLTIAAGLMAIIGLHSVQKEQNWRVFAYPFMFLLAFQLLAIFAHYFVYMLDVGRLWLDVLFLVGTVLIALGFFTASRKSK